MPVELRIARKRFVKRTDKAFVFVTSGYGMGEIFSIADSNIIMATTRDGIEINEMHTEPAMYFKITNRAYKYIEDHLSKMSEYDKEIIKR